MRWMAILIVPVALAVACAGPKPDDVGAGHGGPGDGGSDPAAATCISQLPPAERAAAINSWLNGPLPTQVDGTADCDFYDFAWQSFLSLTAEAGDGYVFTQWGSAEELFPAQGAPPPFPVGDTPRPVSSHQLNKHAAAAIVNGEPVTADSAEQAASLVPLVDQKGRWVHYGIYYNELEYSFIRDEGLYASVCYNAWGGTEAGEVTYDPATKTVSVTCLTSGTKTTQTCPPAPVTPNPMPQIPTGSVALKVAWQVLETCDLPDSPATCTPEDTSTFLTVAGTVAPYSPTVDEQAVTLGLVGFHIVTRTSEQPDGVWMTFEHRANTSDCPPSESPLGTSWSFRGTGEQNMFCTPCPVPFASWDESLQQTAREQAQAAQAILIDDGSRLACTSNPGAFNLADPPLYNPGTGEGQCAGDPIPTETCRVVPIPDVVATLNTQVDEVLAQDASVLANYELVGVMWLKEDCRENADCTEKGTLKLTNTTMETFEQGLGGGGVTGCLVCHGTNAFNPNPYDSKPFAKGIADRSFAFFRIQQREGETCTAPPASYTCPACPSTQQARLLTDF